MLEEGWKRQEDRHEGCLNAALYLYIIISLILYSSALMSMFEA